MGAVVKAIEGPIGLVDCFSGNDCSQLSKCTVRTPIQKIQTSINKLLDSMTLEEITQLH